MKNCSAKFFLFLTRRHLSASSNANQGHQNDEFWSKFRVTSRGTFQFGRV